MVTHPKLYVSKIQKHEVGFSLTLMDKEIVIHEVHRDDKNSSTLKNDMPP